MGLQSAPGRLACLALAAVIMLIPRSAATQTLTGVLIGTVKDSQGAVLQGVDVRLSSPALIGGTERSTTNQKGQLRFPSLPPGVYAIDLHFKGFVPYREEAIVIGVGATIEITPVLQVAGIAESILVEGRGARIEARDPGVATRFGSEDLRAIPTRRTSMLDFVRAAPGISPTSPSSATVTTVSAFGSGTNENLFLIDGTNTTCPCNGIARSDIGVDFIQEVQVQSVVASAEFGNMQGAAINVVTRQGGARLHHDASYYGQPAGLTSQPIKLFLDGAHPERGASGYERVRYRDFTAALGGPVVRDRVWFFAGYQYLRDYDSQPGTDPAFPRIYEQDKIFGKVTWKLNPRLQLMHSFHDEFWVNPDLPTLATPFEATRRRSASVPTATFAHVTYTLSPNTVWDARIGRFDYAEDRDPSSGDWSKASRFDQLTGVTSGAPPLLGGLTLMRTTAKATVNYYRPSWLGADHQWKTGVQIERGEQHGANIIPTGTRYVDNGSQPFQSVSSEASNTGGRLDSASVFVSDAITAGDRVTITLGARFDHSAAISQDLSALDVEGRDTGRTLEGRGRLFTWNVWSPRLGAIARFTADGRTMMRASYGRFHQGVLTGEISPFHPGVTPMTTMAYDPATGAYTRFVRTVDSVINLRLDPGIRAPHTDEYGISINREVRRGLTAELGYIRKSGHDFIGWTEVGGQYRQEPRTLDDGRLLPVFALLNSTSAQRFLLTNPATYSMKYDGLVVAVERRRASGWQALASFTESRTSGLQAASGEIASAAQASTIATPTRTFGRDPNDLTNASGRLPNDRPHIFRLMGAADLPRTGMVVAANLQHFSGKPWAATALVQLPQGSQRILLEPRGSRRLPAQTLLDVRVSRTFSFGGRTKIEVLLDVLNALDDSAAEAVVTDNLFSPNFGQPSIFMDPRRAMLGVRLSLGR